MKVSGKKKKKKVTNSELDVLFLKYIFFISPSTHFLSNCSIADLSQRKRLTNLCSKFQSVELNIPALLKVHEVHFD